MRKKFPVLKAVIDNSNDLRTMNFSIEFVAIDIRKNKENELPKIEGLHIYPIDISEPHSTV